jgi:hypothetical protein
MKGLTLILKIYLQIRNTDGNLYLLFGTKKVEKSNGYLDQTKQFNWFFPLRSLKPFLFGELTLSRTPFNEARIIMLLSKQKKK